MLYSNRRLGSVSLVNPSLMRILVIEDDIETADYVIAGLHRSGHLAQHVPDGRVGIICAAGGNFDVEYLMRNAERVVTRTMLLESVWNFHFDPKTKIVETHMSRLRAKVSLEAEPELIHTIRGAGYVLRAP